MPIDNSGARIRDALLELDGLTLSGTPVSALGSTRDDLRIVEDPAIPLDVRLQHPVRAGSHAAVAAGVIGASERVAIRVELHARYAPDFRRAAMVRAADLSRQQPDDYPALLRVRQCFTAQLPENRWLAGAEVICDVQEWCEPMTTLLERYPNGMPADGAVALMLPVLQTMDRLHARHHWVHRDIDECNVLVGADGALRIADLGIVSVIPPGDAPVFTKLWGKGFAMPPEARRALQRGEADRMRIGYSYDTWQLGRLLYMLLTGDRAQVREMNRIDPTQHWHRWDAITDQGLRRVVTGLVHPHPDLRKRLGPAGIALREWLTSGGPTIVQASPQQLRYGSDPGNDIVLRGLAPRHLSAERQRHGTWVVRDVSPRRRGFGFQSAIVMIAEAPAGAVLQVGAHRIVLP